jgi:pimeloyl-ACP methyl ester carboxylesterase
MEGFLDLDGIRLKTLTLPAPEAQVPGSPAPDAAPARLAPPPAPAPVVFLHDSLGCISLWRDFPARLGAAAGRPVFAYDRQGYGGSSPFDSVRRAKTYLEKEADLLPRVLDAAGIDRASLFGHSDGGTIALLAAAKHPDRVESILVEAGHVFIEGLTLRGIRHALGAYKVTDLRERLVRHHGAKVDALFEAWHGTWLSEEFRAWNIERFLPSIVCPTLVLQGDQDEYGTEAQVEAILRQVSGPARKAWLPGVAHAPHKEVPDRILELAADFLRNLPVPPSKSA